MSGWPIDREPCRGKLWHFALLRIIWSCPNFMERSETRSYVATLEKYILTGLIYFGFAELDRLREVSKSNALRKPLNDEYVPKLEHNIWFWLSLMVMRGTCGIFLHLRDILLHSAPANRFQRTALNIRELKPGSIDEATSSIEFTSSGLEVSLGVIHLESFVLIFAVLDTRMVGPHAFGR